MAPKSPKGAGHADGPKRKLSRRQILGEGSALLGGALASGVAGQQAVAEMATTNADNLPPNVPEWMKAPGDPMGSQLYGMPSPFEKNVVKNISKKLPQYLSASGRTPLQDLDGIITPNGLFYERHHGGVPTIDPEQHRLMLHGLVDRPLIFTMEDIRRFPSESRIHFIECSGNPVYTKPYGKTASDLVGLLSCAEWTGVSLKLVLQEAGLRPEAKWLVAEGADAAALTRSVPIDKCLDDAMLVYSQNGERLRPQQGYPLRLLLPGFEGNMNVKWLRRIKLTEGPTMTKDETSKYTILLPSGKALQFVFPLEAKSVITHPSPGLTMRGPGLYEISGLAWSGYGKIAKVEVSADGGKSWGAAALQEPVLSKALTRFRLPWQWDGAPVVLQSRSTDETGYVQPDRTQLIALRGDRGNFHNNMITSWGVSDKGEVKHVYA